MSSVPVLVVSCDRYADLWSPFFELFWRRWPDCPGPVYLGTNFGTWPDPRVQTLAIGEDLTWASGVHRMLEAIPDDYVIVLLEDFLLMRRVDNARVQRLRALAMAEEVGCLRLYSIYPPPHPLPGHPGIGVFEPGDRYRITAQAAIWKKDTLRRLLVPGFSPWDFELAGSQLAEYLPDRIWGVNEPALIYDHGVEKGKWRPQGLAICEEAGVRVDLAARGAFTPPELERHEQAGAAGARQAERRNEAIAQFLRGRRGTGLRHVGWCLRRQPLSPQVWAIAMAGLLGPAPMRWLRRAHVMAKISSATRAYDRARRRQARAARTTAAGTTGPSQG